MVTSRRAIRWVFALFTALLGALLFPALALWLGRRFDGLPGAWLPTLVGAYGFLICGFGFAYIVTRIAPGRRYLVSVSLVFVTVVVAAAIALSEAPGALSATVLGGALVAGAAGHALRRRGFTERVSGA